MKKNRGKITGFKQYALLILLALMLPACVELLYGNARTLGRVGEHAAILAVAFNMPEQGLDLLRDRFRSELYSDEPAQDVLQSPQLLPVPQLPTPEAEQPASEIETPPEKIESETQPPIQPRIPAQYRAQLLSENFAGSPGKGLISVGAGWLKNDTNISDEDVELILESPMSMRFQDVGEPQVLILHTHATESFERYDNTVYDTRNTWRSNDNNNNMVAVGDAMARVLEENGIGVIHDTTQHDYPSYNGSYERSAVTVRTYMEQYPSIRIVLDLHRDAMEREGQTIVKPVSIIDDKKAAQIMIISGCDDGTMNMPDWRENLRFAAAFQDAMERDYNDLTRPIYFCYRKYNMDLSPGALLLEFGSNANTLEESIYSATLAGQALSKLIWEYTQ